MSQHNPLTKGTSLQRTRKVYAPKTCPQCGKSFVPPPNTYKRQKHCSKRCGFAAQTFTPEKRREAFWRRVSKTDGCWLWQGGKDIYGYGRFKAGDRLDATHRYSYELAHGPIPKGMEVMHTCDTRACVRPDHLRLGSHRENMDDCYAKRRHAWGERNIHVKLTPDQVRYIRANYKKTGPRQGNGSELDRMFGVNPGAIHAIAKGRSWSNLK